MNEVCNAFMDETMELNDLPGFAVGVYCRGRVFTGARGVRDILTKDSMRADDIFHCASVSKLFTASAVMKLVEAGILSLEDRLSDMLPDLHIADRRYKDIRLYQMLSHTSGLGDLEDYRWYAPETGAAALSDYVHSPEVCGRPMLWEAGVGGFRYSNICYEILGFLVSEKSAALTGGEHLSYEDFIRRFLLDPAEMRDSTMLTFERIGVREGEPCPLITEEIRRQNHYGEDNDSAGQRIFMALPHRRAEDRSLSPVKYYPYNRCHAPSSTLTSNVSDLLKWACVNMAGFAETEAGGSGQDVSPSGRILSPENYRLMSREHAEVPNNREKMGLGWFMRQQRGFRLCGHEGTDDGFRSSFWICPRLQTAVVVLSNLDGAPVKKTNKKLFDRLLDHLIPDMGEQE